MLTTCNDVCNFACKCSRRYYYNILNGYPPPPHTFALELPAKCFRRGLFLPPHTRACARAPHSHVPLAAEPLVGKLSAPPMAGSVVMDDASSGWAPTIAPTPSGGYAGGGYPLPMSVTPTMAPPSRVSGGCGDWPT